MALSGQEEFDSIFSGGFSFFFSKATGGSPECRLAFATYCS